MKWPSGLNLGRRKEPVCPRCNTNIGVPTATGTTGTGSATAGPLPPPHPPTMTISATSATELPLPHPFNPATALPALDALHCCVGPITSPCPISHQYHTRGLLGRTAFSKVTRSSPRILGLTLASTSLHFTAALLLGGCGSATTTSSTGATGTRLNRGHSLRVSDGDGEAWSSSRLGSKSVGGHDLLSRRRRQSPDHLAGSRSTMRRKVNNS